MKNDILEVTLAEAVRDQQTVTDSGVSTVPLIEGVSFRETVTQHDDRGTLVELYDMRWTWHPEPLLYVYSFTLEPGVVKGWALHKEHEDRYFVIEGKMEVVMFDPRHDSSTYGKVSRIVLSSALDEYPPLCLACRSQFYSGADARDQLPDHLLQPCQPRQISAADRYSAHSS